MRILASEPASIAKLLDISIRLYRLGFSKLVGFMLFISMLYLADGLLLQPLGEKFWRMAMIDPHYYPLAFSLMICPWFMTVCTCSAAIIYRVDAFANQRETRLMDVVKIAVNKMLPMFLGVMLYVLATTAGFLILLIPGIILMLSLSFYDCFIVLEALPPQAALKASFTLIKGFWWRTATVYVTPNILVMVCNFAVAMLMSHLGGAADSMANTVANLMSHFVAGLITPYFLILGYVQYHDLKLRKSGADLELRLAS